MKPEQEMDVEKIAYLTACGLYEFSEHAEQERIADGFSVEDVKKVALYGELIEDYPEDLRGHSCLMLGWAVDGRPIHAVLTILLTEVVRFITVYEPTSPKWVDPWTRGRG